MSGAFWASLLDRVNSHWVPIIVLHDATALYCGVVGLTTQAAVWLRVSIIFASAISVIFLTSTFLLALSVTLLFTFLDIRGIYRSFNCEGSKLSPGFVGIIVATLTLASLLPFLFLQVQPISLYVSVNGRLVDI
jgi:hypothetical protein